MTVDKRTSLGCKIKPATTSHLAGMSEYRMCCYNCKHCKCNRAEKGTCNLNGSVIINTNLRVCKDHSEVDLIECNICGKFFRTLGGHVRAHGLTIAEYKQLYGYNKSTSLSCSATLESWKAHGKTKVELLAKSSKFTKGNKLQLKKGVRTVSDEGRYNMEKAKSKMTEETKQKMRKPKGPMSEATKLKLSKVKKHVSESTKQKLRQPRRPMSAEAKQKIRTALMGNTNGTKK